MKAEERLPKTSMGEKPSYWHFDGGGSGSTIPAQAGPQNVPFLPSWSISYCPFKHHVVPAGPRLPVLQPVQTPSRTPPVHLLQWTFPDNPTSGPLSHPLTSPLCCSLLHFSSLLRRSRTPT